MNRRLVRMELWRMFHSKSFWATLLISLCIVLLDIYTNWSLVTAYDSAYHSANRNGFQGISLFVRWININMDTLGYAWFFFLYPLIAVLPYGWSLCLDKNSGYIKHIYIRTSRQKYFWGKWFTSIIGAGLVVGIPLFLDLMINALVSPTCLPLVTSLATPMWQGDFFSTIYFTAPWIHSIICLITNFMWGCTIATITFAASYYFRKISLCVLLPQILFVLIDFIIEETAVPSTQRKLTLSPLQLLHVSTLDSNPEKLVFGMIFAILGISLIIAWKKGHRDEVL